MEYLKQLENWLALEPEPEHSRLAHALESDDMGTFYSTAFELFLTGHFHSRGWSIDRHPPIKHSTRAPDFLIGCAHATFYAEAVVGQDPPEKLAQRRVMLGLLDALGAVEGPFTVFVTPTGPWDDRFSRSRVRKFLEQRLLNLEGKPEVDEASIDYTLDPYLHLRFDVSRASDVGPVVAAWSLTGDIAATVTTHETLYDRIEKKVSRYGKLGRPYIVFVRAETEFPAGQFSIERALYGTMRVHFREGSDGRLETAGRTHSRDGIFSGQSREGQAVRTRLSAVGVYQHYTDGASVNRHELVIYHNPYAALPLSPAVFSGVPQLTAAVGMTDSTVLCEWMGDPPEWAADK